MKYDRQVCNEFVRDMKNHGIEVRHIAVRRRNWQGPGVMCDNREQLDLAKLTRVKVVFDEVSIGYGCLHPVVPGTLQS